MKKYAQDFSFDYNTIDKSNILKRSQIFNILCYQEPFHNKIRR